MRIVCAHCQAEGRTGILGEMEPHDDPTLTFGLCRAHRRQLEAEARAATEARAGEPEGEAAAMPHFERVAVVLPVIGWAAQFHGTVLRGMARSVSAGGLVVEFPVEVVRGTVMRLTLQTRRGPLDVEGRIVRTALNGRVVRHELTFSQPKGPDFVARIVGTGFGKFPGTGGHSDLSAGRMSARGRPRDT